MNCINKIECVTTDLHGVSCVEVRWAESQSFACYVTSSSLYSCFSFSLSLSSGQARRALHTWPRMSQPWFLLPHQRTILPPWHTPEYETQTSPTQDGKSITMQVNAEQFIQVMVYIMHIFFVQNIEAITIEIEGIVWTAQGFTLTYTMSHMIAGKTY